MAVPRGATKLDTRENPFTQAAKWMAMHGHAMVFELLLNKKIKLIIAKYCRTTHAFELR